MDVDLVGMDRCSSCGATRAPDAAWCGQCFAPGSAAAPAFGAGPRQLPLATGPARRTRWRKTATTFGPLGRVLLSVAVLVPLPLMLLGGLADPFVWGGAGFWVLVVLPLTLRDVWKAGVVRVARPR